jgi:hypothetical protein
MEIPGYLLPGLESALRSRERLALFHRTVTVLAPEDRGLASAEAATTGAATGRRPPQPQRPREKAWIAVLSVDKRGNCAAREEYVSLFPEGTQRQGTLN